jgi:hypothetical protein
VTRTASRTAKSADIAINPQKGVFETHRTDTWQVLIDHAGSAPIPNMCCHWHLNGKCVQNCFNAASHIQLDGTQIEAVKAWIEKCRARMPHSLGDARGTKKQKLGHSDPSYTRFNFVAMSSPSGHRAPDIPVGSPEVRPAVGFADHHARRGTPHPPERPPAVSPAGGPRPATATRSPPSRTSDDSLAATPNSVLDSLPAATPMHQRLTPSSTRSTSTTPAIAHGPDEGRSPYDATSLCTTVALEPIAPDPPPQPKQSSLNAEIRSPYAPRGKCPPRRPSAVAPGPVAKRRFPATADAASRGRVGRHTRLSAPAHSTLRIPLRMLHGRRSPQLGPAASLRLRIGRRASHSAIQHPDVWVRVPSRAPLSTPLVFAPTLGAV